MEKLKQCRICNGTQFEDVVDLGEQALTGVFPSRNIDFPLSRGPLRLVRCVSDDECGLVQLANSYDPNEMYGESYGYRSGLNPSMVRHLQERVADVLHRVSLNDGDAVIDIGSNDGTTLSFYPPTVTRIGIDPAADKFRQFYAKDVICISEFFSQSVVHSWIEDQKAKIVTAFSMMYDLENPCLFVKEVANILSQDGIFVFEQSYLPLMLENVAFDTICHEHLEYYGLKQIDYILKKAGMEAIDIEFNDTNGGSFVVVSSLAGSFPVSASVEAARIKEKQLWNDAPKVFSEFSAKTKSAIADLKNFIKKERAAGRTFGGLGASTKGNVILQSCELGPDDIILIGDVNPDKNGCFTPGTMIPIVPEQDSLLNDFDYYIVFPWHFKDFFLSSPNFRGRKLVFPLPKLEIASRLTDE